MADPRLPGERGGIMANLTPTEKAHFPHINRDKCGPPFIAPFRALLLGAGITHTPADSYPRLDDGGKSLRRRWVVRDFRKIAAKSRAVWRRRAAWSPRTLVAAKGSESIAPFPTEWGKTDVWPPPPGANFFWMRSGKCGKFPRSADIREISRVMGNSPGNPTGGIS